MLADPDQIAELSTSMIDMARQDFLSVDTYAFDVAPTEEVAVPPVRAVRAGVRCRGLYEAEFFRRPAGRAIVRACVEAGEEARVLPTLPLKMKIVDESAALLPLTATGTSGALLVRSSKLVRALRDFVEALWDRAAPVGSLAGRPDGTPVTPAARLSDRQVLILRLMAAGLKDEAIARRTGSSLRTVRRDISAAMETLAVSTRFAAGVATRRLGLVD